MSWTNAMVETLFSIAYLHKIHLKGGKRGPDGIVEAWNKVNKDIWNNEGFSAQKAVHYKEDEYRKLEDKFNAIMKAVNHVVNNGGNSSQFDGELSKTFETAQMMMKEDDEQEKEEEKNLSFDPFVEAAQFARPAQLPS